MTTRDRVFAEHSGMHDNIYVEGALTAAVWLVGLAWMFAGGV